MQKRARSTTPPKPKLPGFGRDLVPFFFEDPTNPNNLVVNESLEVASGEKFHDNRNPQEHITVREFKDGYFVPKTTAVSPAKKHGQKRKFDSKNRNKIRESNSSSPRKQTPSAATHNPEKNSSNNHKVRSQSAKHIPRSEPIQISPLSHSASSERELDLLAQRLSLESTVSPPRFLPIHNHHSHEANLSTSLPSMLPSTAPVSLHLPTSGLIKPTDLVAAPLPLHTSPSPLKSHHKQPSQDILVVPTHSQPVSQQPSTSQTASMPRTLTEDDILALFSQQGSQPNSNNTSPSQSPKPTQPAANQTTEKFAGGSFTIAPSPNTLPLPMFTSSPRLSFSRQVV